jgi:hypothetical protein
MRMQNANEQSDQNQESLTSEPQQGGNRNQAPFQHPGFGLQPYGTRQPRHPTQQKDMLDEISITLQELNKAVQNVNYFIDTMQELDLLSLLKSLSGSNAQNLLKQIDLNQISELLQSPLVRQLLTDPEILSLFMPTSSPHASSDTQTNGRRG